MIGFASNNHVIGVLATGVAILAFYAALLFADTWLTRVRMGRNEKDLVVMAPFLLGVSGAFALWGYNRMNAISPSQTLLIVIGIPIAWFLVVRLWRHPQEN